MAKKDDKDLSFEEFKEQVYKRIGTLESFDENFFEKEIKNELKGCMSLLVVPISGLISSANQTARQRLKIEELTAKADALLAEKEVKDLLCANLDATVTQAIDAAFKLTPVLYDLAKKDEKKVPLNAYFFAIVCRKIAAQGVANYCDAKPKKGKKKAENETI